MNEKAILFLLVFIVVNVSGHECWLQPDKFIYKRTEPINIKFLVGENFVGENWNDDRDKINCLQLYYANVVDKDLDANFGNERGDSLQLAMIDDGTVMITLNTHNTFIDRGPQEFDQYLGANHLTEALEYRKKSGDSARNGYENYQRCVKTILQVGEKFTGACNKKTDLPLDIVPLANPYNFGKDEFFKVKIYFMGEKLKKTKINIWHKLNDSVTQQEYMTNDEGEVKFSLSCDGEWMVTCVKMTRLKDDPKAEWQSYWSSLTWGYF